MPRNVAELTVGGERAVRPFPLAWRDHLPVLAALGIVSACAWIYLLYDTARMQAMSSGDVVMMMAMNPWTAVDLALLFVMWSVMMVAMMLPSAAAAILTYGTIIRRIAPEQLHTTSIALFVLGYLLTWTAFSLGATLLQWGLDRYALLSPMMVASSPYLGGGLLIAAGIYQFSPVKDTCLKHCRTPLVYLAQNWRQGPSGALRMGLDHGFYCAGCCWAIMGLIFVGGVMNLLWVAALSVFVLLEKLAPLGGWAGRIVSGLGAIGAGVFVIASAF